jgi:hypothetical protein
MSPLERVPADEAARIENVIRITRDQMAKRYPPGMAARRGQHAKDHACVSGTMKVLDGIAARYCRGIFATPGREYPVWIRFSNASAFDGPDSTAASGDAPASHGSRGMAVKIVGVSGSRLLPGEGPIEQDFLMVNHPVFPFANVEDYDAVSQILAADNNNPMRFFAERILKNADGTPDVSNPMTARALRTLGIVKRIQSLSTTAQPPAYQTPPACPTDNQYFAGAPFRFGDDQVMRVRVAPTSPASAAVDVTRRDYLRDALAARLRPEGGSAVSFELQLQTRPASDFVGEEIDAAIEDASRDWDEARFPFVTVASLTIPPQDPTTAERRTFCESLSYSPWHGIDAHRPLGGINRLRRAVYEASRSYRQLRQPGQSAAATDHAT